MTTKDVIRVAKKAGFPVISEKYILSPYGFEDADLSEELSNFYDLVAEDAYHCGIQIGVVAGANNQREDLTSIVAMRKARQALRELVAQVEGRFFSIKHNHFAMQDARAAVIRLEKAIAKANGETE
jgi:hypothetical protein